VRYKPEVLDSEWTELPVQMLWHRQNDHLAVTDPETDDKGAVISGLESREGQIEAPPDVEGGDEAQTVDSVARKQPSLPTVPLATVGPMGEVSKQNCLLAILREEDGLEQSRTYNFAVRVGDLYRLSEWSEPSASVKLAIPPPDLGPALSSEEAQIRVSEVMEKSFRVAWPQFVPATHAGVPITAEVEYLLEVTPQVAKKRLAGRGHQDADLPLHSQWLRTSTLTADSSPEQVGWGKNLSVVVGGLEPGCSYELRLRVRYSQIGVRSWSEGLKTAASTRKCEGAGNQPGPQGSARRTPSNAVASGTPSVMAASPEPNAAGGIMRAQEQAIVSGKPPPPPETGKRDLDAKAFLKPKEGLWTEGPATAVVPESPRRLPPLPTAPQPVDQEPLAPDLVGSELEEWMSSTQADVGRLIGGGGAFARGVAGSMVPAPGEADVRPSDFQPFWHRDPSDSRPAMPAMPTASHSAMQLDLCSRPGAVPKSARPAAGEAMGGVVPRPPDSARMPGKYGRSAEERTAYPRRVVPGYN